MTRPARLFRLDDDPGGLALSCDETGLALAGVALLRKTAKGFEPRPHAELDLLLRHANTGRDTPLALPPSGLGAVAEALNRGDLVKAQLAALFMRVPELDTDSAVRLILADDTLAKTANYDPDQPRDGHGRWTAGGGAPTPYEAAASSLDQQERAPPRPAEPAPAPSAARSPSVPATPAPAAASHEKPPQPGAASKPFKPGALASRFETSGKGPGTVSTGKGDKGGPSYGTYQINSKYGLVQDFVAHEGAKWPELQGKIPGTPAFNAAWKSVAAKDPAAFDAAQYAWNKRSNYDPMLKDVRKATGLNPGDRSQALQEVMWSIATQHGPGHGSKLVERALKATQAQGAKPSDPDFDKKLINAIYDERSRTLPDGQLAYFPSSPKWRAGLIGRMRDERRVALEMLAREQH
jgi:hypothetical protein